MKLTTVSILAVLLLVINYFFRFFDPVTRHLVLFLFIPIAIIVYNKENLSDYGLQLGDYKLGGIITGICVLGLVGIMYFGASIESLSTFYSKPINMVAYIIINAIILFSWEFFFRGWLMFSFKKYKHWAIVIQTIPFVLVHITKPPIEMLLTIPAGLIFGWITYRTKSIIPAFLIHWIGDLLFLMYL